MPSFVKAEGWTQDLKITCPYLEDVCTQRNAQFVHGRGNRKSKTQKYLELFRGFPERQKLCRENAARITQAA